MLALPRISTEKDGPAWSPVDLEGNTRSNAAVKAITAAVLDLDHLTEEQAEGVAKTLEGRAYIVHSTFGDVAGDRRFRCVLPLSRAVTPEEWRLLLPTLVSRLGLPADPACKDPSRLYFLPTRPQGADYLFDVGRGDIINVEDYLSNPVQVTRARTDIAGAMSGLRQASLRAIMDAAAWLEQHGPAIEGKNGDLHTYIACAALTHDFALSPEDAWPLLRAWNQTCQPPWQEEELASKARNAEQYAINEYGSLRADLATEGYGTPVKEFFGRYSEANDAQTWIIPGMVARGVAQVIAGPPKSMKTFLAEHMALTVASAKRQYVGQGGAWLHGHFNPVMPGKVLLIPREDTPAETKRRLDWLARGMGVDISTLSDYLFVEAEQPFRFDDSVDMKRMVATLEKYRPDLIIIDPLAEAHRKDENSASDMKEVIDNWADLCRRFNVAIVCLHHWRKPGEGQANRSAGIRMRGTSALHARVRHVVGVESREKGVASVGVEGNLPGLPNPFLVKMVDSVDNSGKPCIRVSFAGWV